MNEQTLRQLLDSVRTGRVSTDAAFHRLRSMPFEDLGFAKIDHHREIRCGFPEVIYCEGKTTAQVIAIMERRLAGGGDLLATRALPETAKAVLRRFRKAQHNAIARTITVRQKPKQFSPGFVAIACAGTSDLPVAEEARETCEIMGQPTRQFYDVGVAGIHRLLAHSAEIQQARAVVVCAGMEGALASVVGGLVRCPVIGVPTSVGYGANFGGIAPLLTMLNSCAAGVSVVNIDNGFGAGYIAALIGKIGSCAAPSAAGAAETNSRDRSPKSRGLQPARSLDGTTTAKTARNSARRRPSGSPASQKRGKRG